MSMPTTPAVPTPAQVRDVVRMFRSRKRSLQPRQPNYRSEAADAVRSRLARAIADLVLSGAPVPSALVAEYGVADLLFIRWLRRDLDSLARLFGITPDDDTEAPA